jgi:cytochrome c553
MYVSLRITFAAVALLTSAIAIAARQGGAQQDPRKSYEATVGPAPADLPQWPYPLDPMTGTPAIVPDDGVPHRLPRSEKTFTLKQIESFGTPDWFPDAHPKAPVTVIDGKPGEYFSCGSCHLMNGKGWPETQGINGLPIAYMQQQFEDLKNGLRRTAVIERLDYHMMRVTVHLSEDGDSKLTKEALEYFHSLAPGKWIRVVEAASVPKTVPGPNGISAPDPGGAKEPIGNRIVELPESYDRARLHDPTSGFVAYVPPGSLTKGEALVKTVASGRTMACSTCHGADLRKGIGDTFPPIAGRSPTAIGRQLYDFKTGARHGQNSAMMKPVVEKLTDEDIVDISAYLASLPQ